MNFKIFSLLAACAAFPAGAADNSPVELQEVVVKTSTVSKARNSAFNTTAINTKEMAAGAKKITDALSKAPGLKVRRGGGAGSDLNISMDGLSGKHVKIFIDGVPQEGMGAALNLNNIPVDFAERIEVYRGVVPVAFGGDAIGGAINIVTPRKHRRSFVDASYSLGSFNTHNGYLNFGQNFDNGINYEINAFANYSDNDYWVDAPVEDFATGAINRRRKERVRRFNDAYRNASIAGKLGLRDKPWADRLTLSLTAANIYKEIQTGVRQEIVFGAKHRHGYSVVPAVDYLKRNLFTPGLSLAVNANYRHNSMTNVDTSSVKYNWKGASQQLNSPGEQSNMLLENLDRSLNSTANLTYRIGENHLFTLNNSYTHFSRESVDHLPAVASRSEFAKTTGKNITGLSYRYNVDRRVSATAFGKFYHQAVSGPVAIGTAQDAYRLDSRTVSTPGYGLAATYFLPLGMQAKASYERAVRLPSVDEMFGDGDLENGDMALRPETSHNININLSYNTDIEASSLYAELSASFRDTRDFIQRNIVSLSGGKAAASYINYGRTSTKGISGTLRYNYSRFASLGGSVSYMDIRDNMPKGSDGITPNLAYGQRMPNLPYFFTDMDAALYFPKLGGRFNMLTISYDNRFTRSFCYYSSNIGTNASDYMVPNQWEHNVSVSYGMLRGRYTVSLECRNLTDAKLYDNFSLQRPGRAFYAKFRIYLQK